MSYCRRESMKIMPMFIQPFLTWMTGMPLKNEIPLIKWTPTKALLLAIIQTGIGILLSYYAMQQHIILSILILLISWLLTTGGMRRLDVIIIHHSLHNKLYKSFLANRIISEIITTILWRVPYDSNRKAHIDHHRRPCSDIDYDLQYILSTGFKKGMSKKALHLYIIKNLLSPIHHGKFLWRRIKANYFTKAPIYRHIMLWTYSLVIIVPCLIFHSFYYLILWLLPITVFFQSAIFLYTLSEHRWTLKVSSKEKLTIKRRDSFTFGRLCGDSIPRRTKHRDLTYFYSWLTWWLRVFFVHCPYRSCVLVGDTVQHDTHHIQPGCDWANSAYIRRDDMSSHSFRYQNVWGDMMDHIYEAAAINKNKGEDHE